MLKEFIASLPLDPAELTAEQYKEVLAELENSAAKDDIIKSQSESLTALQEQLNVSAVAKAEVVKVEIDGVEYVVAAKKFKLLGDQTSYTAEDVVDNADLQKKILAIEGQNILIPA